MSFPNGVPQLLNVAASAFHVYTQAYVAYKFFANLLNPNTPRWGIYKDGKIALEVDGFADFGLNNASQLATYKIESGAFNTYNKVDSPYDISVVAVKTGTDDDIGQFLKKLEIMSNDINLYQFVLPEITYTNCNIEKYGYRRSTKNGTHIIYAEIMLKQILNTAESLPELPKKSIASKGLVIAGYQTPIFASPSLLKTVGINQTLGGFL